MKRLMAMIMMILALAVFTNGSSYAQLGNTQTIRISDSIDEVAKSLKTPEEISAWLSHNFKYTMMFPNKPQSIKETLETGMGDCDDFANLTKEILARNGVECVVYVVKLKDLDIKHAICAWKGKDGKYLFMDNTDLKITDEEDLEMAIKKIFPDCEKFYKYQPVSTRTIW